MSRNVQRDLIAFLRDNVDTSTISVAFDPGDPNDVDAAGDVGFSDPDGAIDYPRIAVATNDPLVPGGGQTGFSGMDGTGGGPIQDVIASVLVHCWGGPIDDDTYQGTDHHPDDIATELGREVWSSCLDAAADTPPDGYEWISADPPGDADDDSREETHYRDQTVVRLKYTETP